MKKSLIALSILALSAGTAFAHGSSGTATGSNSLTSNSATSAAASGTGSATSEAWNQGRAATSVNGNGAAGSLPTTITTNPGTVTTTDGKYGNVSTGGSTFTLNASGVRTTQSGSALAVGAASGVASSQAQGVGEFHTTGTGPIGSVSGNSSSLTATGVASVGNGAAVRNAGMSGSFGATASADITNTTVRNVTWGFPTASQSDVKNVNTAAGATAVSNGGFAGTANMTSGTATGYITNISVGNAAANASVAGKVSASH
jgi:hypothetical protein